MDQNSSQLALPLPTPRKPTVIEREIFEKCLLPSINQRKHGKVALCCYCFFSHKMVKIESSYCLHVDVLDVNQFRRLHSIDSIDDFVNYCEKCDFMPQMGGSRCLRPMINVQAQEIAKLRFRADETEQECEALREQCAALGKRMDRIEKKERERDKLILDCAAFACCGASFCMICRSIRAPDDRKLFPLYQELVEREKAGKYILGKPSPCIVPMMERKLNKWRKEDAARSDFESLYNLRSQAKSNIGPKSSPK